MMVAIEWRFCSRYRQLPSFLRYYYKVFFVKNQAIFIKLFMVGESIS